MQKNFFSETLNLVSQTLPFLMITVTFISIAYVYGHTAPLMTAENAFEASKIDLSRLL
ncbi:MAG: hypothetical protein H0X26_07100 [Alphaproteobacteria bacterium]|nr:hypothetical protein [Alphaproteobacteria bacterium]